MSEDTALFKLTAPHTPAGDQPSAIQDLLERLKEGKKNSVLLGVTGSGKTFTMAHVIQQWKKPTLILAPNKTLAAQLYGEMKSLFPLNAVEYFVSYYDYYQPEAFVPRTSTYIEKEATINEHIDRLRHSATRSLLERKDVIVVASVSCIYGIGSPEDYGSTTLSLKRDEIFNREAALESLVTLQYKRNDLVLTRGTFRLKGDVLDVFPAHYEDRAWRLSLFDNHIESIYEFDPLTGKKTAKLNEVTLYPNSHYVIPGPTMTQALKVIKKDLKNQLDFFESEGKLLEAQRLKERITFDIESMATMGSCSGIENYSRYFTGRNPGEPPPTLFEYLPSDALLIVDESHVAIPQLGAMYKGDAARKHNLSTYGFRLPSCADNRPLKFEEWQALRPQTLFVSATPGEFELQKTEGEVVEQLIRPTGLLDPLCFVHPTENQVDHLIAETHKTIAEGGRVLVTTLTKKMAEALKDYLLEVGLKAAYIHSDVDTLERIDLIQKLRHGDFDVLIGINLLREGLDIPECALVAIMDADKTGYLRSKTSLIQTIGRAARNKNGRVLLYADHMTKAMEEALGETQRRRTIQEAFNKKHNIKPQGIQKAVLNILGDVYGKEAGTKNAHTVPLFKNEKERNKHIKQLEKEMLKAADNLDFEKAAKLRDRMNTLMKNALL